MPFLPAKQNETNGLPEKWNAIADSECLCQIHSACFY
jgi:hypothetical protein